MKSKIILLILLLFPFRIFAQISVAGKVTDTVNSQPVPYATIYVNGTTRGTITNKEGQYLLERVVPPCEIVISHVSYETVVIAFEQSSETNINVVLKPRDVVLGDVVVTNTNLREENLQHFRDQFLGTDYWGENAYFENDSVLLFSHRQLSEGDNNIIINPVSSTVDTNLYWFVVETKEPLIVYLPLLGYKVHVNLINYKELRKINSIQYRIHILGYFFFQPTETDSKRKTNSIQKKRLDAYYNSGNHFCNSLINNRLKENGYRVFYRLLNEKTGLWESKEVEFENHIVYKGNEAKIIGLKNISYNIEYYQLLNKPMNLKEREGGKSKYSSIRFLKDTCTIRADGSRPDNSIMFGYSIGEKRVGAMLPNDFEPVIQK